MPPAKMGLPHCLINEVAGTLTARLRDTVKEAPEDIGSKSEHFIICLDSALLLQTLLSEEVGIKVAYDNSGVIIGHLLVIYLCFITIYACDPG